MNDQIEVWWGEVEGTSWVGWVTGGGMGYQSGYGLLTCI